MQLMCTQVFRHATYHGVHANVLLVRDRHGHRLEARAPQLLRDALTDRRVRSADRGGVDLLVVRRVQLVGDGLVGQHEVQREGAAGKRSQGTRR
jgi:hypothetical protein